MKIICIGKNYVNHAKEMGSEIPKEPLFFLKPDSAILPKKHPFFIPDFSKEIHYELELLIKIKKLGKHIGKKFASSYYSEIGLGIDFTARDLQNECKINGHPWEKAKAFDHSAVIGSTFYSINNLNEIHFELKKNGNLFNQLGEQEYAVNQIHIPYNMYGLTLDSVVEITHKFNANLLEYDNAIEIYAIHKGLIYKEEINLNINNGNVLDINYGTEYTQIRIE